MRDRTKGFAVIELLVLVIVLVVTGVAGWRVYSDHHNKERANNAVSISSATLSGIVTEGPISPMSRGSDGDGVVVANHTIQALDTKGNVIASAKTNSQGKYILKLSPGQYNLSLVPPIEPGVTIVGNVDVKYGANSLNLSVDTGIR